MRKKLLNYSVRFVGLAFLLCTTVCSQTKTNDSPKGLSSESGVKVTYIANEGVLISSGEKQVLIDGLHRFYNEAYAYPPDDLRSLLENAKAPYNKLDLLLVSHLHGDHFHSQSIGSHLVNNSKSVLVTSKQVVKEVKKGFSGFDKIKPQIKGVKHEWKKAEEIDFQGVKVKFLGLRHGNERFKWIENLGHLIEIGGKKFLHLGDADMTAENFSAYKLNEENIDVAFIPFWFLLEKEGRDLVKSQFNPKHIVAVHVSPKSSARVLAELKKHYSDITVFTKILETKTF